MNARIDWDEFGQLYGERLREYLYQKLNSSTAFSLQIPTIANESGEFNRDRVEESVKHLVKEGALNERVIAVCSNANCGIELNEDEQTESVCPYCYKPLVDFEPVTIAIYHKEGGATQDIRWVVVIHGMNTRGKWQEEFSWKLAWSFGYSIPVSIYKYGLIRLSPFIRPLQRRYEERLKNQFATVLEVAREKFGHSSVEIRPTIIAHSFGTLLLSRVLDKNPDLRVGRVILTGSIVRPTFNWKKLIQRGQVSAVLCHCACRDSPVRLVHFSIPGSGPSGVVGFNDKETVAHVYEQDFGHSTYFEDDILTELLQGTWRDFLTQNEGLPYLSEKEQCVKKTFWKPSFIRFPTIIILYLLLLLIPVLVVGLLTSAILGWPSLLELISRLSN